MRAEPVRPDIAGLLRPLSQADIFARPSSAVLRGALRLEAGFYGSEGYRALQAMEQSGFEISSIGVLAGVRWFGPFSRNYVNDAADGVAFLSSSEMMAAKLEPRNFLSTALTPKLERLLVHEGTILVSCSGTIGNVAICTRDFHNFAVSQHAIRVDPKEDIDRGVLYAFLLSELGQFLITRNKSGSVIESIYAVDVAGLPLPLLPKTLRRELSEKLQRACDLRVKANALLNAADAAVGEDCNLPPIESFAVRSAKGVGAGMVFSVSAAERLQFDGGFGRLRLDATFHEPRCAEIRQSIAEGVGSKTVQRVTHGIYRSSLRERSFVDDVEQGVPMIGGKQLTHSRLSDIKYLSRMLTRNLAAERIASESTLVTCGGTVGRVLFAHRNYENWIASEHVMKLVPNRDAISPGFLYAFFASPYGQVQVEALLHGSVIPQVRDFEFGSIVIAIPVDRGEHIHQMVVEAFENRADAKDLEDYVLGQFMNAIESGRSATEEQWGREY